ncbi:MAG TPA: hypothetical protein VH596_04745 [Terriglobales bacterium]|jgi:hypothetical protein
MSSVCQKPQTTSFSTVPCPDHLFIKGLSRSAFLFLLLSLLGGTSAYGAAAAALIPSTSSGSAIVVGFVGGFVSHNDLRHSEVQLANKLKSEYGRAHVAVFENRHRDDAHTAVLKWLDGDGDPGLSDAEKREARIILYGHSWGASAVVALARQLQTDHIPVLLTIQVDSISKPGLDDHVIPANVERAVNFFQTGGVLHGEQKIVAADPEHTEILGDFRFNYKVQPAACSTYPWIARHFMKGHTSIECDPKVWSRIESLITRYLITPNSQPSTISTNLQ